MAFDNKYRLRLLSNGSHSVHSLADDETFHPGIGPVAEAEALYVRQLRLIDRANAKPEPFVLWDVGLGAAANALTAIRLITESVPCSNALRQLRIISFDQTLDAAAFALQHAAELVYPTPFAMSLQKLIEQGHVVFTSGKWEARWTVLLGDFPSWIRKVSDERMPADVEPPHAILFDPHSPRKNPAMWTVSLFSDLFRALDPTRPCSLANFTRSTLARAAMLLGGFYVGAGHPSGMKEETTVAANRLELIEEPLDERWLQRAERSDSAEPLWESVYRQSPLRPETLRQLREHPQFKR